MATLLWGEDCATLADGTILSTANTTFDLVSATGFQVDYSRPPLAGRSWHQYTSENKTCQKILEGNPTNHVHYSISLWADSLLVTGAAFLQGWPPGAAAAVWQIHSASGTGLLTLRDQTTPGVTFPTPLQIGKWVRFDLEYDARNTSAKTLTVRYFPDATAPAYEEQTEPLTVNASTALERVRLGIATNQASQVGWRWASVGQWDDWPPLPGASGPAHAKVWNGSAWADGTATKVWNGSAWIDATATRVWNGSAWVDAV